MKIIFAQGNPGSRYKDTRHNIGFTLLDIFAKKHSVSFSEKSKSKALIGEIQLNKEKIILVKPTTFYNETGNSARAVVEFYKSDAENDLIVIHDDIALPFGAIRARSSGSSSNNGIKSLNAHIGEAYWRLRVGIYTPLRDTMHDADFVLSKLSVTEQKILTEQIAPRALQYIDQFINETLEPTSYRISDKE